MLLDKKDTDEKTALGGLWAAKSGGECVFLMVSKEDFEARIREAVA
jgi:hypothetical protein